LTPRELQIGDVVQLAPSADHAFSGCFMLVTEPKPWGAQGFVSMPGGRGTPPGEAYFRAKWEMMEFIGTAAWAPMVVPE
jgi:hypothetical protein